MARVHCTWRARAVIAIATFAAGCSAKDEIHCVTPAAEPANPMARGMSLCFDSRRACETYEPPDPIGPHPSHEKLDCVGVPEPAWHCWGFTGTRDPVPSDSCLPSRALCERATAGQRERLRDDELGIAVTECTPTATAACAVDERGHLVCQSTMLLCEAAEEMMAATLKGHQPRRCEERHSGPAR